MFSFQDFLFPFLDTLTSHIILVIFLLAVLDERPQRKRLKRLPFLVLSPLIATMIAVGPATGIPSIWPIRYIFLSLSILSMCTLWFMWAWRPDFWRAFSFVCMAGILQIATAALDQSLLQMITSEQEIGLPALAAGGITIATAAALLLKKLRFAPSFRLLLEDEANLRRTALLLFLWRQPWTPSFSCREVSRDDF